jgi:hypothetical protein
MRVSPWLRYHAEIYPTLAEALSVIGKDEGFVYLCGGINGLSDADCRDWRETAKESITPGRCIDPMVRDYRGREDECVNEIVEGDLADIRASGVVLVNASRASWGTAMEIVIARGLRKRVMAFMAVK